MMVQYALTNTTKFHHAQWIVAKILQTNTATNAFKLIPQAEISPDILPGCL